MKGYEGIRPHNYSYVWLSEVMRAPCGLYFFDFFPQPFPPLQVFRVCTAHRCCCFFFEAMGKRPAAAKTAPRRMHSKQPGKDDETPLDQSLVEAQPEEPAPKAPKTDEEVSLTAEALEQLKGAEDQQVEESWNKCSTRQQQVLWKKFQSTRKSEGTEAAYLDATKGTGRNAKRDVAEAWKQQTPSHDSTHD